MKKHHKKKKNIIVNRAAFLGRVSELLKEGYTFPEAIYLILPHHTEHYEAVIENIEEAYKQGLGASAVLEKLGFSHTTLLSVMIAEQSGHLADVLASSAMQLQIHEATKKKLKGILAYPIILFIFISGLLIAFRNFFLPNMEAMSYGSQSNKTVTSTALPYLVAKLPDVMIGFAVLMFAIVGGLLFIYRKQLPENKIRFIKRLPIIRKWVFQWKSQRFARELGSLLESGISIQQALDVLIEQQVDVLLSQIAIQVRERLIYGEAFHLAVALTDGLTKEFSSFAKHGEASGHLAKELLIYSAHLEETLYAKMSKGLALLQPALFALIALCILAAYLALLLPIYGMMDTI